MIAAGELENTLGLSLDDIAFIHKSFPSLSSFECVCNLLFHPKVGVNPVSVRNSSNPIPKSRVGRGHFCDIVDVPCAFVIDFVRSDFKLRV